MIRSVLTHCTEVYLTLCELKGVLYLRSPKSVVESIKGFISFEIGDKLRRGILFLWSNTHYQKKKKNHFWSHCRKIVKKISFFNWKFLGMNMNGVSKSQAYERKLSITSYWVIQIKECKLSIHCSMSSLFHDTETSGMYVAYLLYTSHTIKIQATGNTSHNERREHYSGMSFILHWSDLYKAI